MCTPSPNRYTLVVVRTDRMDSSSVPPRSRAYAKPVGLKTGALSLLAPAIVAVVLLVLVSACGRQPSQDTFDRMQARLEQLEGKVARGEAKDSELIDLINDGKAESMRLEKRLEELARQVEALAARPSVSPARQPDQQAGIASRKKLHTVARGETLYSIAKRYGLSVDELRRVNNLTPDQVIQAGQSLVVSRDAQ